MSFAKLARNIGNLATGPGMAKASSTAIGSNTPRRIVRHSGRGSSSGLNANKTARVQPNGSGYSNPLLHPEKNSVRRYPNFTYYQGERGNIFAAPRTNTTKIDITKPKTLI